MYYSEVIRAIVLQSSQVEGGGRSIQNEGAHARIFYKLSPEPAPRFCSFMTLSGPNFLVFLPGHARPLWKKTGWSVSVLMQTGEG